jgi:hypothetical protein
MSRVSRQPIKLPKKPQFLKALGKTSSKKTFPRKTDNIFIESDGTTLGTKAFYPDGSRIGGIIEYIISPINNQLGNTVTLHCYLGGKNQIPSIWGELLRIETNGNPSQTQVFAPDGTPLTDQVQSVEIDPIVGCNPGSAKITFFLKPRK